MIKTLNRLCEIADIIGKRDDIAEYEEKNGVLQYCHEKQKDNEKSNSIIILCFEHQLFQCKCSTIWALQAKQVPLEYPAAFPTPATTC